MRRSGLAFLFVGLAAQPFSLPVEVWAVSQDDFPKYEQVSYGQLRLALKRSSRSIELVIQGAGPRAQIEGRLAGSSWEGLLIPSQPSILPEGDQVLNLPGNDLKRVELKADGSKFKLSVRGQSDSALVSPTISTDGLNLIVRFPTIEQSQVVKAQYDLNQPGRLPQSKFVPPVRARAIAPPVGDMAIGSMLLQPRGLVQVSGPPVTLTTKHADARELLMSLSRVGGYGIAFVEDHESRSSRSDNTTNQSDRLPITVSFKNEPFSKAFNIILMTSGLQARLEGGLILVGKNVLAQSIGNQLSKVYRLNQVDPGSAAEYLANLGAIIKKTNVITTTSTEGTTTAAGGGATTGGSTSSTTTSTNSTTVEIEAYGATTGPLLGLQGTTDSRLGTITLIGDSQTIAVAEGYLRQLDLRKRQVAVEIKIINIDLSNGMTVDNSVYYKTKGGQWLISKSGRGYFLTPGLELPDATLVDSETGKPAGVAKSTTADTYMSQLVSTINSSSAKTLASPTLLVQEGSTAKVEAVRSVITDVSQSTLSGGNIQCSQTREDAGLIVPLQVKKIDDNGFVTLSMKPSVSVPEPAGNGQCAGPIAVFNIVKRELDTGTVRLRDGQTLVLTGVISDDQRAVAQKVPILGDLPLIGQYFRQSTNNRQKSELIILATPRIVRDGYEDAGGYGSISVAN